MGWTSSNDVWARLTPYQKAAAMALMEADGANPNDARNALGAMINRAGRSGEDLGAHVSRSIYQPTIEPSQEARLGRIMANPRFNDLAGWAERRASGNESDPVNGATHFLAPERTMLGLEAQNPRKYRSWRSWAGFDPETNAYRGVIMRDGSHAFLAPEGAYSVAARPPSEGPESVSDPGAVAAGDLSTKQFSSSASVPPAVAPAVSLSSASAPASSASPSLPPDPGVGAGLAGVDAIDGLSSFGSGLAKALGSLGSGSGSGGSSGSSPPPLPPPARIAANMAALRLAEDNSPYGSNAERRAFADGGAAVPTPPPSSDGDDDTGDNLPETLPTLLAQQNDLIAGRRPAQMFPVGTGELPLPDGMGRVETPRGTFHFHPARVTAKDVALSSLKRRENDVLGLGPLSKDDIRRVIARTGERPLAVVERDADENEVKASVATPSTAEMQARGMAQDIGPDHRIGVEPLEGVLADRMSGIGAGVEEDGGVTGRSLRLARADGGAADDPPLEGEVLPPFIYRDPRLDAIDRDASRLRLGVADHRNIAGVGRLGDGSSASSGMGAVGTLVDEYLPGYGGVAEHAVEIGSLPARMVHGIASHPVRTGAEISDAIVDPSPGKVGHAALDAAMLPVMFSPVGGAAKTSGMLGRALDAARGPAAQKAMIGAGAAGAGLGLGSNDADAATWSDAGDWLSSAPGRFYGWLTGKGGKPKVLDEQAPAIVDEPYGPEAKAEFLAHWQQGNPRREADMGDVTRQAQTAFRNSGAYKAIMQGRDGDALGSGTQRRLAAAEQQFIADYLGRLTPGESPADYEARGNAAWSAYRSGVDEGRSIQRAEAAYRGTMENRGLGETPFSDTWWGRNINPSLTPWITGAVTGLVPALAGARGSSGVAGRWQKALDEARTSRVPSNVVEARKTAGHYAAMAEKGGHGPSYALPMAVGAAEGVSATYLPTLWDRGLPDEAPEHRAALAALSELKGLPDDHPQVRRFRDVAERHATNVAKIKAEGTDLARLAPDAGIRALQGATGAAIGTKVGASFGPSASRIDELAQLTRARPTDPKMVAKESDRLSAIRDVDASRRRSDARSDAADRLESKALRAIEDQSPTKALTKATQGRVEALRLPEPSQPPQLPSASSASPALPSPPPSAYEAASVPPRSLEAKGSTRPIQGATTEKALTAARATSEGGNAGAALGDDALRSSLDHYIDKARAIDPSMLEGQTLADAVRTALQLQWKRPATEAEVAAHMPTARAWFKERQGAGMPRRARGGPVHGSSGKGTTVGPLMGPTGGRSDHLPISVPAGSHVIPADVVSGHGEGNTAAGMLTLDRMFNKGPYGTAMPKLKRARRALGGDAGDGAAVDVPILASDGEYVVSPNVVTALGGGDLAAGHDELDRWIVEQRNKIIDTLARLPGPAKD